MASNFPDDVSRAESAIWSIDPGLPREQWLQVAMSAKSVGLSSQTFVDWSSGGGNFKSARDCMTVWRSIKPEGGIGPGTLFGMARDAGWSDASPRNDHARVSPRNAPVSPQKASGRSASIFMDTWDGAKPASASHAYITRKLGLVDGLRVYRGPLTVAGQSLDGALLVPAFAPDGSLATWQAIPAEAGAQKLNAPGRPMAGTFIVGGPVRAGEPVFICEGIGAAWSAHQATAKPAVVAFGSSRLQQAAQSLVERFPGVLPVLVADVGKEALCEAAAAAVGGLWVGMPAAWPVNSDINDLHQTEGLGAVAALLSAPQKPAPEVLSAVQRGDPSQVVITRERARAVLVKASTMTPEPIKWFWDGWLARGKLHILGGAPGTGKTTLAMSLAATVSVGGRWPDGTRSAAASVVIWTAEDDPADTLAPRLALAGADLDRVSFLTGVDLQGELRAFDPAYDIVHLREALMSTDVGLLIVDPIVAAISGDSHKNAEVRRGLQPLVDIAAEMGVAVLGITHLSKGTAGRDPLERLTGSLAFGALARVVFIAAKHQDQGDGTGQDTRLFVRVKSNIGPDGEGFQYSVEQGEVTSCPGVVGSAVRWGAALHGEARELLSDADASPDSNGDSVHDAKAFLADLLSDGPVPVKAVRADAEGAGYTWATIRRAQKAIGVEAVKEGGHFGGSAQKWVWRLPTSGAPLKMLKSTEDAEGAQRNDLSTFSKSEHRQSDQTIEVDI
jgi:putative DNA primase/helicase